MGGLEGLTFLLDYIFLFSLPVLALLIARIFVHENAQNLSFELNIHSVDAL